MKLPLASPKSLAAGQSGSYLLEALIAILIFAFGVLGLIGLLGSSIRVTNDACRTRTATAIPTPAMVSRPPTSSTSPAAAACTASRKCPLRAA